MAELLRFEDVSFSYGGKEGDLCVLDSMSLHVHEGEFLAIVGPSGTGKSTILALMAGLKSPKKGHVVFAGKDLSSLSEEEHAFYLNREIGMIYQFFNLIPELSALDNVALPALIRGVARSEARKLAKRMLAKVGLQEKVKSKVSRLSGGQQQRVAIARAFINEPKLILADEPTGNLDRRSTLSVMDMLCREREQRQTALVVVTHDREVAMLADSLLELR